MKTSIWPRSEGTRGTLNQRKLKNGRKKIKGSFLKLFNTYLAHIEIWGGHFPHPKLLLSLHLQANQKEGSGNFESASASD